MYWHNLSFQSFNILQILEKNIYNNNFWPSESELARFAFKKVGEAKLIIGGCWRWGGRWGHGAKTNTKESQEQQGGLSYMPGPEQNIGMRRQELKPADLDLIQ